MGADVLGERKEAGAWAVVALWQCEDTVSQKWEISFHTLICLFPLQRLSEIISQYSNGLK